MSGCKLSRILERVMFITFIILILKISLYAQEEECAFALREAQNLYNQGLIEDIPEMLQPCIQKGFTKEERLEAYKLIILCHLFNDDQTQADEAMRRFLRRYPEYEISPTDPVEFTYLFESYDTKHKFTYGVFFGGNMNHASIIEPYCVFDLNNVKPEYSFSSVGIMGGARINFFLGRNLELCLESIFSNNSFSYELGEKGNTFDFGLLDHKEIQNRIDIPVSLTYDFTLQKFSFFFRGGIQAGYLLSSSIDLNRVYVNTGELLYNPVKLPGQDVKSQREELNLWTTVGVGLKYKITKGYLILDVRYNIGLMNQVNQDKSRYIETDQVQDLNFLGLSTDCDFRLNNLVFTVGYLRSFYKPKKK